MNKPKNRKYRFDSHNAKVGDIGYTDGHGPCSGGFLYDVGDRIIKVTDKVIILEDGNEFSKKKPYWAKPPSRYTLTAYTRDER